MSAVAQDSCKRSLSGIIHRPIAAALNHFDVRNRPIRVNPEAEYRVRLNETRRLIDQQVPEHLERGAQAAKRGALDDAQRHYLAALALQPDNVVAGAALRQLERERMRRQALGRPARLLQAPRAPIPVRPASSAASAPVRDD